MAYVVVKFFSYQLFDFQKTWPGVNLYKKWNDVSGAWLCCVDGCA